MDAAIISALATTAVSFLSPYLAKSGEVAAKKIGEDLYQALKKRFSKKPAAQEALADIEKEPNDTDIQAALRIQLKKLLAEDEAFAEELQNLLKEEGETARESTVITQTAGDNAKQFGQVHGNVTFGSD